MKYVLLTILIIINYLLGCSKQISGNVTQTGNPVGLRGQFFLADGSTPARNISVTVLKQTALGDTSLPSGTQNDIRVYVTDEQGFFSEEKIDTGLYVVEAFSGDTLKARVDSVYIKEDKEAFICDTLKQTGTICGTVFLSEGGDARKVFILVYGSNIVMTPDSVGNFCIKGVAEGTYDLRIVSSIDAYDVLERKGIEVPAGKVVIIDTLVPRFNGLPTVKNLKLEYDSVEQVVLLSWDHSDTSVAKGYAIYRKSSETNNSFQKVATLPVQYNSFRDSSILTGESIEYTIVTFDKNGNEGMKTAAVSFSGKTLFENLQVYSKDSTFQEITDIFMLPGNRLAVVDFAGNQVCILDSTGETVNKWGKEGNGDGEFKNPIAGVIDDSGFIYILEMFGEGRVQKFDLSGKYCGARVVSAGCTDLDFCKGSFYVTNASESFVQHFRFESPIVKINATEKVLCSWSCICNDTIYAGDQMTNGLVAISPDGAVINKIGTFGKNAENFSGIGEIALSPEGYLYVIDQNDGDVQVFSKNLEYIKTINVAEKNTDTSEVEYGKRIRSIAFDNDKCMYIADNKRVYRYKLQQITFLE